MPTKNTKTKARRTAKAVGSGPLVSPPSPCRACEIFDDGPCSPKAFDCMQDKVARAIHAEHNRHEGETTLWISLHRFQRDKYRGKAYAALIALGIPAPALANPAISHAASDAGRSP